MIDQPQGQSPTLSELFAQLTELKNVPVPPMLERALGYPGYASTTAARYVSFYYTPLGDEAMYDDGRMSGDGDAWGFLDFVEHRNVRQHLTSFDFGNSDAEGQHRLLLDRESTPSRKLYAGPAMVVACIVSTQWRLDTSPESEIPNYTDAEIDAAIAEMKRRIETEPTNAEILAVMQKRNQLLAELTTWLNQQQSSNSK